MKKIFIASEYGERRGKYKRKSAFIRDILFKRKEKQSINYWDIIAKHRVIMYKSEISLLLKINITSNLWKITIPVIRLKDSTKCFGQGRRPRGNGGYPPNGKNCCRKMMLFPLALFLVKYSKIVNFNFYIQIFIQNVQTFLKLRNNLCF